MPRFWLQLADNSCFNRHTKMNPNPVAMLMRRAILIRPAKTEKVTIDAPKSVSSPVIPAKTSADNSITPATKRRNWRSLSNGSRPGHRQPEAQQNNSTPVKAELISNEELSFELEQTSLTNCLQTSTMPQQKPQTLNKEVLYASHARQRHPLRQFR